jgi:hypothetical protein
MAIRKITVTFEIEDGQVDNGFIDKLINEVNEDKKQLAITQYINKETTILHRKTLIGIVDELNGELCKAGLMFTDYQYSLPSNGYRFSYVMCKVDKHVFKLAVKGRSGQQLTKKFTESKYTTYTGEYDLKIGFDNVNRENTTLRNTNMVLKHMTYWIKEHLINQQLL